MEEVACEKLYNNYTLAEIESWMLPDSVDAEQCPMFVLGRFHSTDGVKC